MRSFDGCPFYRDLVRKLHPDRNRNIGWREVQAAYRERDLERLEAAAGRLEVGLNGASLASPIQILRRMTQDKAAADLRQLEAILDDLSARASRPRRRRKSRAAQ